MQYKRILLKLSGEALMGNRQYGIDPDRLAEYAQDIKTIIDKGVEVAIVIGGGNIFRGVAGASRGIEDMSEIGDNDNLEVEMQTLISAGEANQYKIGPASIPGNGTDLLTVEATQNFSKLSYVAMIAPSPDWFSGVSSVSLFENDSWVNTVEIDVKAYDAGTENGNTFSYDNAETIPQQPITQISDAPLGDGTTVSPRLGYLRITLQE